MTKLENYATESYPTGLAWTTRILEWLQDSQLNPDREAVAKTKRRIEITVEKHRLIVLSRRNHSTNVWCEACGEKVQMVTPDEAAQLCGVTTRTVYSLIENERLHYLETETGFSLICLQSIAGNGTSQTPEPREEKVVRSSGSLLRSSLIKRMWKRSNR